MANNNSKARRKRWTRIQRLEAAKKWIPTCRDDDLVRRYKKWFGVTDVCAVLELRMLGVDIPDARLEQARRHEHDRAGHNARRKQKRARRAGFVESDETFAFIVDYTEGGAPYGVTWAEWEGLDVW
jgi:NMD protein affecting ribosome stability and mRNA decay